MAERFGTFKDFLKRHDSKIDRKRRPEIEAVMKAHYDKYGSSDEEEDSREIIEEIKESHPSPVESSIDEE